MKIAEFKALQFGTKIIKVSWSNKSYDRLHPGTAAQNSSQIPVGAQGFVVPHPGCIYSYHKVCPALNSKPYWSNKQVVPLLGCCSDAPGSPGSRLVICGDGTFFQPYFWFEIWLSKHCCTFATLRDLHVSESANFFFRNCYILPNLIVFFAFSISFTSQHREIPSLIHVNIRAHGSLVLKS